MALAGQEMEKRLATTVGGLRRGLADARSLHASLRAEAAELESFVPVLIQGAVSGIHDALRQQVSPLAQHDVHVSSCMRLSTTLRHWSQQRSCARNTYEKLHQTFCNLRFMESQVSGPCSTLA